MAVAALAAAVALLCAPLARAAVWSGADTLSGKHSDDQFGWSVAGTGDLDGDGLPDFAVGAHYANVGTDTAAGSVFLVGGGLPPGVMSPLRFDGATAHEHFGESLAGGADVNGDGVPDLIVGAPLRDDGLLRAPGAVDVFLGGPGMTPARWTSLKGEAADDWFGQSVAIGDLDGDGLAEIIVGAPFNDRKAAAAGAVFIYRGGALPPAAPWKILVGEAANDQFGWSVTYLGDMDGDGYGDIAVGARMHSVPLKLAAGRVYLFRGGPAMDAIADGNWSGEAANDWFGHAVWGPGDVDGGGRPDLLVGAPFNDRNGSASGAAYLFRGESAPGSAPVAIYVGESANAQLGWAVGGAGDVDGDGRPDIVVGAHFQASGALTAAGRAYLFAGGATLSTTARSTADGEAADDWFGQSVGGGFAFLNAGRGAMLVGAPLHDHAGPSAGRAYALGERPTLGVAGGGAGRPALTAWPVPARQSVELTLAGAGPGPVDIAIVDVSGRELLRWRELASGALPLHTRWDGRDRGGRPAPAGLYLVRMTPVARGAPSSVTRIVLVP